MNIDFNFRVLVRLCFTSCLLLLLQLQIFAQQNVLDRRVTLQLNNLPLVEALDRIEQQSDVSFAYTAQSIDKSRRVNLSVADMPLSGVLKLMLYEDGARFTAVGSQIIIYQPQTGRSPGSGIPVRDTIWTQVINTVNVIDTQRVCIADTIQVYDTIEVNNTVRKKAGISRKKKAAMLQVDMIAGLANIKLDNRTENTFSFGTCSRTMAGAVLTGGLNTEHWSLRTGAGIVSARQSIHASSTSLSPWEARDSLLQYRLVYDSSYLAIPGVDTAWVVDKTLDQYYTYSSRNGTDTLHAESNASPKLIYIRVPIALSFTQAINRKLRFFGTMSFATDILVSGADPVSVLSPTGTELANIKPAPIFLSAGISTGIDMLIAQTWACGIAPWYEIGLSDLFYPSDYQHSPLHSFGIALSMKKYF